MEKINSLKLCRSSNQDRLVFFRASERSSALVLSGRGRACKPRAARYAELQVMPYKRVLRVKRWKSDNVSYYVTICREYEDGTHAEELREGYSGKERHIALKRFAELQKQHPGIESEKHIEKSKLER